MRLSLKGKHNPQIFLQDSEGCVCETRSDGQKGAVYRQMQRQRQHLSAAARINTDLCCCWETESDWLTRSVRGGERAAFTHTEGQQVGARRRSSRSPTARWFLEPAVVVPGRKAVKVLSRNVSTVSLAARPRLGFRARTVDCTAAAEIPPLPTFLWTMRRKIVNRRGF